MILENTRKIFIKYIYINYIYGKYKSQYKSK